KVLLVLLIVFFLSMALGFYLGEVLESNSLGFLATGGIFILIIVLIRVFEIKIEKIFINITIKKIMSKWGDDDEDEEDQGTMEGGVNENAENRNEPEEPLTADGIQEQDLPEGQQEQARV